MCICVYIYLLDLSSTYICDLCPSKPGLLHLAWCSPVPSICRQTA
jgi:hypothetical protein